jgi:hypothetical protein
MLSEKKGTCCHKCGHVHVKGTKCPTPYLKGERSCARRSLEEIGPMEKFVTEIEASRTLKEGDGKIGPAVQALLDECDRIIKILRDDELYEKEVRKHQK